MSQFWHAHWAEDGFKPSRLQNWEVPKWHPEWPDRHCTITKFEAHKNGRLFSNSKKSNPWGNFKGTWELPGKIDRKTAEEISKATEYKKSFWRSHKLKHERLCKGRCADFKICKKAMNLEKINNEISQIKDRIEGNKHEEKEIAEESKSDKKDAIEHEENEITEELKCKEKDAIKHEEKDVSDELKSNEEDAIQSECEIRKACSL